MSPSISQAEAIEMFDIPTVVMYVCDGGKECGKPSCHDWQADACHHTLDESHALYPDHDEGSFVRYPTTRDGEAAIILVEPIRG